MGDKHCHTKSNHSRTRQIKLHWPKGNGSGTLARHFLDQFKNDCLIDGTCPPATERRWWWWWRRIFCSDRTRLRSIGCLPVHWSMFVDPGGGGGGEQRGDMPTSDQVNHPSVSNEPNAFAFDSLFNLFLFYSCCPFFVFFVWHALNVKSRWRM